MRWKCKILSSTASATRNKQRAKGKAQRAKALSALLLALSPWLLALVPMKLLSISLGSWLLCLLAILLTFSLAKGAKGFQHTTVSSLIVTALLFSLAYAPSLYWLRKRMGGCKPAVLFPLASAVVLNLPVFLIEFFAIGRTLAPSEAFACIGSFLLMGAVFGLCFVWNYQDTAL